MPTWPAEPHTLAKIIILRKYLDAWFPIVGRGFPGRAIYYIDGFAGPGRYATGEAGSPVVALEAAEQAFTNGITSGKWKAGAITCIFIESDAQIHNSLMSEVGAVSVTTPHVKHRVYLGEFDFTLNRIRSDFSNPFGNSPVFVFVDPFGPTRLSFDTVANILRARSCEVLLHFDADGATRIIQALNKGFNKSSKDSLDRVFGNDSWNAVADISATQSNSFEQVTRRLVQLYLARLRTVSRYAFPFQMITPAGRHESEVGYYLIMATNHALGLEKMKSVMKGVGQDGAYRFSNFRSRQPLLFNPPSSKISDSESLLNYFKGRKDVKWSDIVQFTLNETDFISPKTMLKFLEDKNVIEVRLAGKTITRKRSTYPDQVQPFLRFNFP